MPQSHAVVIDGAGYMLVPGTYRYRNAGASVAPVRAGVSVRPVRHCLSPCLKLPGIRCGQTSMSATYGANRTGQAPTHSLPQTAVPPSPRSDRRLRHAAGSPASRAKESGRQTTQSSALKMEGGDAGGAPPPRQRGTRAEGVCNWGPLPPSQCTVAGRRVRGTNDRALAARRGTLRFDQRACHSLSFGRAVTVYRCSPCPYRFLLTDHERHSQILTGLRYKM